MNDVRKKAEEKAKQKLEQTSSGESDRQKARRQLKDEISSYTGENVTKFEAVPIKNRYVYWLTEEEKPLAEEEQAERIRARLEQKHPAHNNPTHGDVA